MTWSNETWSNQELAELALDIAREAGALAASGRDRAEVTDTKSSPLDMVTQMDRACEELIRDRLTAARPRDAILGEEGGSSSGATGDADHGTVSDTVTWIVDPIDGTVNYFYGQPSWAVSIAAERAGEVVAGAVVAPALGEEYLAARGAGSFRVDQGRRRALSCSQQAELSAALIATGFGYLRERREQQGQVIAALLPEIRDIRRAGAAALDLCWVAAGFVDASYEHGLQPWDRAAGGLVAEEAGARVAGLRGQPASEDMTIAAPEVLFEELAGRLAELGAGPG